MPFTNLPRTISHGNGFDKLYNLEGGIQAWNQYQNTK